MGNHLIVEGAGQLCLCAAEIDTASGKWLPTVYFERKADAGRARVAAVRHRLEEHFDTEAGAVQAAEYYAERNKDRGTVEL